MNEEFERRFYEAQQRINWWINGIGVHCIPCKLFMSIPTERIVELYNVNMNYFRPIKIKKQSGGEIG